MNRPKSFWLLPAILLFALLLRLFHLDYRGFWTDEFRTLFSIGLDPAALARERMQYGHFPTYYLMLKAWAAVFGDSEIALRLPSVLAVVAATGLVWSAARREWGVAAAAWAALFFALHGRMIWAAQEARPYGLVVLAAAGATHALARALERRGAWWPAWAAWTLLGLFSHATFLFVFAGQLLVTQAWLSWRNLRRTDFWLWAAPVGIAALASFAWLRSFAAAHVEHSYSDTATGLDLDRLREGTMELFWGQYDFLLGSSLKYLALPLGLFVVWLGWRGGRRLRTGGAAELPGPHPPLALLATAWGFSILLGMGLITALVQDMVRDIRYFAPGAGGVCLLMGAAVASLRRPRARWSLAGAILFLLAAGAIGWHRYPGEQVREALRLVAERRAADEPVLFCKGTNSVLMGRYYGLGTKPVPVDRDERSRKVVARLLDLEVAAAPGWWLILYNPRQNPIADVAVASGKFEKVEDFELFEVRVKHYRRAPPVATSAP